MYSDLRQISTQFAYIAGFLSSSRLSFSTFFVKKRYLALALINLASYDDFQKSIPNTTYAVADITTALATPLY